jgi:hypothetical protein
MVRDVTIVAATMLVCVFMISAAAGLIPIDALQPTALMVR